MSSNKSYAVFGLGRYGLSVAKELVRTGAEVITVDICEATVNSAVHELPFCKCADITDSEVIKQLGIANVDVVIIATSGDLEASVMSTMLCKEAGVKTVIVKCANEMHRKILLRVGADQVVFPEKESGIRLAKNLLSSGFVDIIELSDDASMVELDVKSDWIGKSLLELNLRRKYMMNIVAIRTSSGVTTNIDPEVPLTKEMKLIVIANPSKLAKLK